MKNMKLFLSSLVLAMLLTACDPAKQETNYQLPDVPEVVMYQVNPRVFAPEKSLNAVTARLDSIKDLGVNVIWIMPIYPIGEEKSKNSPYSIKNYKEVAPEFGTKDDFKRLTAAAHDRGMAVILDWVGNHTAWDALWLKDQGHKDWYTQDSTGAIIFPPGTDWYDVADLNYDNKDMRAAMVDAMKFWIVDMGLDGFRCDVADWVPVDFWQDAIGQLREAAKPRKILMLAEGKRVDNFTAGFDMNYAWDFKDDLVKVFNDGVAASDLFRSSKEEYDSIPDGKMKLRFTTNHDHSNEITPVKQFVNARGSMAAWVAAVMLKGGPLIYGSQEVGYPDPINFFHYVPVDWTANPEMYQEYKKLIGIYNNHPALRRGDLKAYPQKDVLMFTRTYEDETILVMVNVRNSEQKVALPDDWRPVKNDDLLNDGVVNLDKEMVLPAFEYRIYKRMALDVDAKKKK